MVTLLGSTQPARAVLNGILVSDTTLPAVRRLGVGGGGTCTGTVVGPRALLTAGHCVSEAGTSGGKPNLWLGNLRARSARMHPKWAADASDKSAYDVALVKFGEDLGTSMRLSERNPQNGDPVRIIGYGLSSRNAHHTVGVRRMGSNVVHDLLWGQIVVNRAHTNAVSAVPLPGDSGGPLVGSDGKVLGVCSKLGPAHMGYDMTTYVSVAEPEIRQWLREAADDLDIALSSF
ncbi:MAG: trypsin-like peptidase domain-containing protein [Bdellovibrionales bacterium]|nr:trypsin-like peptidase domain-containing protein [Bdellovibrionales bacterium]